MIVYWLSIRVITKTNRKCCRENKNQSMLVSIKNLIFCLVLKSKERIYFNYCFRRRHYLLCPTSRALPPVSLGRLLFLRGWFRWNKWRPLLQCPLPWAPLWRRQHWSRLSVRMNDERLMTSCWQRCFASILRTEQITIDKLIAVHTNSTVYSKVYNVLHTPFPFSLLLLCTFECCSRCSLRPKDWNKNKIKLSFGNPKSRCQKMWEIKLNLWANVALEALLLAVDGIDVLLQSRSSSKFL